MAIQYSAVCYGGLTGNAFSVDYYYDAYDNTVYYTYCVGTHVAAGTKLRVVWGYTVGTILYDSGVANGPLYWDAGLTNVFQPTGSSLGVRLFDTHTLLLANTDRYGTRVYNSLTAMNTALGATVDATRTDIIEILDIFGDTNLNNPITIGIPNYETVITTTCNGVRTSAFHNFSLTGYYVFALNITSSNTTIDGLLCKFNGNSNTYVVYAPAGLYNVFYKNCVSYDYGTNAAYTAMGMYIPSGGHAFNCLCVSVRPVTSNYGAIGFYCYSINGGSTVTNCLSVGFSTGFYGSGATIQNCAAVKSIMPFSNTGNSNPRRDSNNAVTLDDCVPYTPVVGSANHTYTKPANITSGVWFYGASLHTTGTFPTVTSGAALSSTAMYDIYLGTTYINIRRAGVAANISFSNVGTGIQRIVLALKSTAVAPTIIPDYNTTPTNTFVDPANFDFRLAVGSTLIDAAINLSLYEPTDGLANVRPSYNNGAAEFIDIGPLEFDKGFGPHPVSATLLLVGLQPGSDVVILAAGTSTVLASVDANAGSSWAYTYTSAQSVDIYVIKPGYEFFSLMNYSLGSVDASVPVSQRFDRNYS